MMVMGYRQKQDGLKLGSVTDMPISNMAVNTNSI